MELSGVSKPGSPSFFVSVIGSETARRSPETSQPEKSGKHAVDHAGV